MHVCIDNKLPSVIHCPWRDRGVASLLWTNVTYCSIAVVFEDRKWHKINDPHRFFWLVAFFTGSRRVRKKTPNATRYCHLADKNSPVSPYLGRLYSPERTEPFHDIMKYENPFQYFNIVFEHCTDSKAFIKKLLLTDGLSPKLLLD